MLFKGRKFSTNKVLLNKRQFIHDDGFAIVNEFDKMRLRADKRNNRLLASIDKKNFDQQVDYQRSRTDLESDIMPDYFDKNRTDADLANDEFANRNQLIANCLKIFKGNEIKANELMQALLSTGLDGFFNKFITRIIRMVYENFGSKPKIQDVIDLVTFLEANQNSPNFWNMAQTGPAGPQGQQGIPGVAGPAGPQGRPPTPQNPRVPTPQGQPPTPPFVPINQPPRVPTPQGPIIQPIPRGPTPPTPRGPTPPAAQPPTPPAAQPPTPPFLPITGSQPPIGILALAVPTLNPNLVSIKVYADINNPNQLLPVPDDQLLMVDFSVAAIPRGEIIQDIIQATFNRDVFISILQQRYNIQRSISRLTVAELRDRVLDELSKEIAPPLGTSSPSSRTSMRRYNTDDLKRLDLSLDSSFDIIDQYLFGQKNAPPPNKTAAIEILTQRYGMDRIPLMKKSKDKWPEIIELAKKKVYEERVQRNATLFASSSSGNRKRGGTP
jgi:hypothetical protein